jgi:predicted  nucleic acid-binding Zn-ribbon protein
MNLELEKLKMNKKRVSFGIEELEFKILELNDQIKRIESNIQISKEKIKELDLEIKSHTQE